MSRLGKSFKNRFLRRALAMVLAGTMVLSGMPVSFAAEQSDAKTSVEAEVQGGAENASEEAAEDGEVSQKESEKAETKEQESVKSAEETETASEKESTETKKENTESIALEETEVSSEIEHTGESETDLEEDSETEGSGEENRATYDSSDATLADGHKNANWGIGETIASSNGKLEGSSGTYTNSSGDVLFVDAQNGKFFPDSDNNRIQIKTGTNIYIPVQTDESGKAKIIIYQSTIKNKEDIFNNTKEQYLVLSNDGRELDSEGVCTAFSTTSLELTVTLGTSNAAGIICIQVKGTTNKNIYATKIISGEEVEAPREDVYEDSAGDSADLRKYAIEGYAGAANVTGGGVIKINEANYHKVSTAEEFLQALVDIKKASKPAVIRITKNLNLGSNEIKNIDTYKDVISAHKNQPICSPVLGTKDKEGTGVSMLSLDKFQDLTIFSTNGAAIKHCCIVLKNSENIVFRNLVFDELWEWDDLVYYKANSDGTPILKDDSLQLTEGDYDRNDWDYICVDSESDGVWIDHCTFYKSYDGVIDIKNPKTDGEERVTVSWCRFEDKSAPDKNGNHPFYDKQLQWLKENIDKTNYYKALMADEGVDVNVTATDGKLFTKTQSATIKGEGFSDALIESYTRGQKKTHLLGQGDTATNAVGIRATFANNIYKNSMDRMPRLRRGNAHLYNSVLDASDIYYAHRLEGGDTAEAKAERAKLDDHLVSNGAISTVDGNVFVDTCYIDGIEGPILSGNGDSAPGYIGWDNCEYKLGGSTSTLEIKYKNNSESKDYTLTKEAFSNKLPKKYAYSLYTGSLDSLSGYLSDKAGAGTVSMTDLQWTKVSYGDGTTDSSNPTNWDPSADNDPSEDEGNTEPPEPDVPPVEQNDKEFRAGALETQAELAADLKVNDYFTVTKGCGIVEGTATINDINFTKYIKFSGEGTKENSIQINASGKGTIIVYAASNNESDARTVKLLDSTGSVVSDFVSDVTVLEAVTLQIPEAGVYYVASAGGELYVYGIDLNEDEGSGEENPTIEFSLSADDIHLIIENNKKQPRTLKEDYRRNGFTIKSSNTVVVDESKKTVDGISFTQRIKLGAKGDANSRSIRFKAETAGTLTVFEASASSTNARECQLYKVGETTPSTVDAPTGNPVKRTFEITNPGEYYVTGSGAINICYIAFSNKAVDPTPPDDDYAPEEVDAEWTTLPALTAESVYNADDAKDASKVMYNLEGYAGAANVTGGGLIKENTKGYHKVTNEEEFLKALKKVQGKTNEPNVIEITTDLNLGKYELKKNNGIDVFAKGEGNGEYSGVIKAYTVQPSMHPTLKETGVSYLNMHGFQNLTIFSKNGATIKHAGMKFEDVSTKNVIIRNLAFDELWEWDEGGTDPKGEVCKPGDYDINDWDYMTIDEHAEGIWIDHCTFYKAYDGLIDIKNNSDDSSYYQRVTISWCEFLPGSKDNVFFNEQMKWLEDNINNEKVDIAYYRQLRNENMKAPNADKKMSAKDVWWYAYGQKKAHLLGSADTASEDKVMRVTLANNYYKNAMSRLPRLRFGKVHEYNCVFDSQQMNEQHNAGNPHITGNGAISACKGEMLLENNYIRGVRTPLRSGYNDKKDDTGYINFIKGVYYIDGSLKEATITESSGGKKVTDEEKFKAKLPEGYVSTTRDATQLYSTVVPYAGAGKLDMTIVQWEATNYGTNDVGSKTPASPSQTEPAIPSEYDKAPTTPWDNPENPDNPDNPPAETIAAPTAAPSAEMEFPSIGGEITLSCADGATIYYTISDTEAGLTDPADAENANRQSCATGTKIPIKKETYIWAVAVKDKNTSEPLKCHYTVAAEGEVLKPFATPDPAVPVASGTKVTLSSAGEFDAIYYTTDAAVDLTQENGGRETYNKETGIVITETVTIRAVAKKGDKYSSVATFTYTVKTDVDPDPDKTVASPVFSKAEGVVKKGEKITIDCATEGASIYYTTDGTEPKAEEQFLYTKGTEIVINQTTTIRAIAVKGENKSSESKATYTVEGTENPPVDPDEPEIKTIKLSECTITVPSIMESTKKGWKPQSVTYVTYQYKNENGETKHVKFAEGVDYDADWTPGKQADGTYKVILTGRGRAADERSVDGFIIDKTSESAYYMVYAKPKKGDSTKIVDISKAKLSLKNVKNLYYTGYAHEPEIDYAKDKDGLNGKLNIAYRNNINAGKATVVISAKPGTDTETIKYVGSKTLTFTIKKAALNKDAAKATARVSIDEAASKAQQYMGGTVAAKGLKVETVVTAGEKKGVTLKKDEDYTVTYKNKAKDGAVTVTMTVKGVGNNLSGNCVKTFTIQQLDLSGVSFTEANGGKLAYSPSGKLGTITVMKDGNICTLKEGVDFAAKYEYDRVKKKDAGSSVKVTITGKGVCKGTNTASFEIVQADFAKHIIVSEDAAVDKDELAKKGDKAFEKAFTVTDAAGTKFKAVKDYTITPDKTNKTITIKPNSTSKNAKNYTGEITFPYRVATNLAKDKNFIFNKDLEKRDPLAYDGRNPVRLTTADIDKYLNKNISASDPNYDKRTYRLGGKNANIEIVSGTYKNNAKKGTAQVTVRGVAGVDGGFYGQKVLKFKIVEK